jgi:hypothetical protein
MLKVVSDSIVALPYRGNVIIEETMFVLAGISPMAILISSVHRARQASLLIPLHDPVVI